MPGPKPLVRIPSLKTVADFRSRLAELGIGLPCDDAILIGSGSPLNQPLTQLRINGKQVGNRLTVQPMEGWDATTTGQPTEEVRRRWQRFGQSGAKLICGGEAMAVRAEGRANPHQLIISERTKPDLAQLRNALVEAHRQEHGRTDDLVIGFQLTHSGRFCRPNDHGRGEPRVAYRHPLLDPKFGVTAEGQIFSDGELEVLIADYVAAAKIAWEAGADFVDLKHCHGYLLHEFLSAHTRAGRYGGSFENRTRLLGDIVQAIRSSGNPIDLAVRLSAFDFVPFRPDPACSTPGKPGPGIPEDYTQCLPYRFAFGVNPLCPTEYDLSEPLRFAQLCGQLGIKILNLSAGSPYYNPHIQRPAAYPPSDGYLPPEDPLVGVARQMEVVRRVKQSVDEGQGKGAPMLVVGSAYSYLQEYLPVVAQAAVRDGWTDSVGLGRMVLSYPRFLADALADGRVNSKAICRTFSDCTTAPRKGLMSGCYPLDKYYSAKPEAQQLKAAKAS